MAEVTIKHKIELDGPGGRNGDPGFKPIEDGSKKADAEVEKLKKRIESLSNQLQNLKEQNKTLRAVVSSFEDMGTAIGKIPASFKTMTTASNNATKAIANGLIDIKKAADMARVGVQATVQDYRTAMRLLGQLDREDLVSERQSDIIGKRLNKVATGKMTMAEFEKSVGKISKRYADELGKRLDISALDKNQMQYAKNMEELSRKYVEKEAKAAAITAESGEKLKGIVNTNRERLKQEQEITKQKQKQTKEMGKQAEARTARALYQAGGAFARGKLATEKLEAYEEAQQYADLARQQKLARNEDSRQTLRTRMQSMFAGTYQLEEDAAQRLMLATKRLKDTAVNIRNFAMTQGYKGTVGAEATSELRAQQFYKTLMQYASEWKRVNSWEGKAADILERMGEDAKDLQGTINGIHTAFGQLASTVSAVRQIGVEIRKGLTTIIRPVLNVVQRMSSTAFQSSLEALKDLELSRIGFSNFYGESAVEGIVQNIKQNALLSPMSASQLADYVNQLAPLSQGNSQLAINAAMGVAKMIQYSGGEVSSEMEYVIRNLRDVIAKGKALTIDIRQFNRAMPALTRVLNEMGETDMLKNGELFIDATTAPRLLEAFQRINEFGDVADIFDKTSTTISGLLERLEEQMQLFIIDVGEFSGLTDLIKNTLHSFLEDENGLLSDLRMNVQFIGRDVTAWLKSRDWERVLNIAKEVTDILWQGLKDSLEMLKGALGGTDWRESLKNLAELISSFVKGIANSYSWLLGIMNTLNKSGILGSGVVQGAMGVFGFLSGNAGTLITGGMRGLGTAMGFLSKTIFVLINEMELAHGALLKEATTIHTFDEALAIASQSLAGFGETVALIQEIINSAGMSMTAATDVENQLLLEEGLRAQQMRIAATVEESRAMATKASTVATEAETAAREANTASINADTAANTASDLLGPARKGKGTRLGEIFRVLFKALTVGGLVGTISSGATQGLAENFGADKYGAANAGNIVGSIGGFASGGAVIGAKLGTVFGPLGTLVGAAGGGLIGAIKAGIESSGILDQARKDELDTFKETVNNGTYLKEVLNSIDRGNDISVDEFDTINSNLVSQMNQWAAATPSGTAQMLKDYLRQIEINGRSIDATVKEIGKTQDQQAETLWKFVEADDIEGGNDYAKTLQNQGLSSYQIAAMIMQKAFEHGKNRDEMINYLLMWGSSNNAGGLDLTSDMIAEMNDRDKEATREKLKDAWTKIGMENVQNLDLSYETKVEVSKKMGEAMAKLLVGAMDEMSDSDWASLTRLFSTAKIGSVAEQFGYAMDPNAIYSILNSDAAEKYGINANNVGMWSNDSKGHGAEDANGNPLGSSTFVYDNDLVKRMTDGMTAQEKWNWLEQNIEKHGQSTKDVIDGWLQQVRNKEQEANSIGKSQEQTLWEIRDSVNTIANKELTAQQQFEELKQAMGLPEQQDKANGGIVYLAAGGSPRGVDTVPAMLQPGEFVVRRSAVQKVGLSAMNALNTGNLGYFARTIGRQDIYGDYNAARTWNYNRTSNDNRRSNRVIVNNFTRGQRLNRYYGLANRMI